MSNDPSEQQQRFRHNGRIIVVSGPSGVGKGTLLKKVLQTAELPLELSVSATTRAPRPDEKNGVEYFFLPADEFHWRRENGEFLECFEIFRGGHWYGTLRNTVESRCAAGKWIVLEIDVQGGLSVQRQFPDAVMIFIHPKNVDILKERLAKRGTESQEAAEQRLQQAAQELKLAERYTYHIVNDDLNVAARELMDLLKSIE
ncbi:MAG: guanylate kinase [Planctomycetaceae bacterium]|jgi:guanylate kinase|nr:guanylate kinase [Planctomycetaceae bacterium]